MSTRGWALFAAVSVVWGMPYLFIKIGVEELTPGFVAWSRVALAAVVLLPIAIKTGALRGLPLRWLVAFAAVEIAVPFPLIGFGEQRISSSLAAILIAALPLVVAFLALRFDHAERPTPIRLAGMLVGLARGRRAGRHRHRRPRARAAGRRGRAGRHARLRVRSADRQAAPGGSRPARARDRRDGDRLDHAAPVRHRRLPDRDARHRHPGRDRRARAGLLGRRLPPLLPPDRRGRAQPGDRDHLRQPDRGARPRRGGARRERDRRRRSPASC